MNGGSQEAPGGSGAGRDESRAAGPHHDHRRARRPDLGLRLRRSRERRLGGVAAGVAAFVGADPRAIRLLWLVSVPFTGGLTVVAYLLLWLILPGPERP